MNKAVASFFIDHSEFEARPAVMPETTFHIPTLLNADDAAAVMFELQDLPCVNQADVDLPAGTAWVSHTTMLSPDDVAAALAEAGHPPSSWTT